MTPQQRSAMEQTARAFYAAALATDWERVAALVTDDFVIHEASGLPFGGDHHGVAGLQTLGRQVFSHFKRFAVAPERFAVGEDSVAVWINASGVGRQTGDTFEMPICEWLHFRDGRIASITPFYWDGTTVNAI